MRQPLPDPAGRRPGVAARRLRLDVRWKTVPSPAERIGRGAVGAVAGAGAAGSASIGG
ncbi:hypothetical protein [Modestobacter lapidis]|nr:hypothetical protein [Modestobacter lapidis]